MNSQSIIFCVNQIKNENSQITGIKWFHIVCNSDCKVAQYCLVVPYTGVVCIDPAPSVDARWQHVAKVQLRNEELQCT